MRLILRFLSSLWLGLVLIALLTLSCIGGSLIASNEARGPDHAREYVFHTWWFLGLMGLLLVNLALCSWEKSYIALTLYKKKNFISNPNFFQKAAHSYVLPWQGTMEQLRATLKKRYPVVHERSGAFYAQRGLFGRTGATIIHIGLLWTMAAGYYRILADDFGWGVFDSTIILPEGESTRSFYSRIDRLEKSTEENLKERTLPFTVRALDFRADFYPHSTVAQHFSSLVEIRDEGRSQITEVTMTNPMLYKGYKLTQNSYSDNERILREKFRVTNLETGEAEEVDVNLGDPVRMKTTGDENLFFQVDATESGVGYRILDLAHGKTIESGPVQMSHTHEHADPSELQQQLTNSKYAVLAAALFPNFRLDKNNQPTTEGDEFKNPAVLMMLFKNGEPNGYVWLFNHKEAQAIMGQPHLEMEMEFLNYRKAEDASGSGGLYDYEVEIKLTQKEPRKELGTFWIRPGKPHEVEGIDEHILHSPPVSMESGGHDLPAGHSHDEKSPHGTMEPDTTMTSPGVTMLWNELTGIGGAGQPEPTAGGSNETTSASVASETAATSAAAIADHDHAGHDHAHDHDHDHASHATGSSASAANPNQRFAVNYLGTTTGHVTYLGFMKDPSVGWLFTGCMIIIGGTLIAFMITYRETWVYYDEATKRLYLATQVRGSSPGAHREFDRVAREVIAGGTILDQQPADETATV